VVLWRCRTLYNVALEQRKTAWERWHVSVKRFAQEAELADIHAEFPEYAAVHSHILQDVVVRLDKAYQAFFRRVAAGETPGYPRFQGRNRYHSFTYKEYSNGVRVENGHLVLSKIGRIAVHWSRRTHAGTLKGTIKTVTISKEADGWYSFRTILTCKAEWAGKRVVAVPPAYTSQDCSGCGERVEKSLSVRTHVCPSCGLILDRDENAARNIQWAGQALRGLAASAAGLNREPVAL
jgi:transposase